jgi:hypothetical protein
VSKTIQRQISKGRSKSSKSVLFLSDMHVGNIFAVCSPKASCNGGLGLKFTKFNKDMYDNWCDVKDMIHKKDVDVLCLNGDACDGSNRKSMGNNVWSTNILDQLADAERLVRMYNWREIVMTRGSRYHVAVENVHHEEILAMKLGVLPYSGLFGDAQKNLWKNKSYDTFDGDRTDFYLWFILGGKRFSVTHHIGFTKWFSYKPTAMGREMADLEFARGKWYPENAKVDAYVRSHVHYYVEVRYAQSLGFTTPAWKLPDEHLLRGGLGGTIPTLGTVEVIVETNGEILVYPHTVKAKRFPKPYEINFDQILAEKHGIN